MKRARTTQSPCDRWPQDIHLHCLSFLSVLDLAQSAARVSKGWDTAVCLQYSRVRVLHVEHVDPPAALIERMLPKLEDVTVLETSPVLERLMQAPNLLRLYITQEALKCKIVSTRLRHLRVDDATFSTHDIHESWRPRIQQLESLDVTSYLTRRCTKFHAVVPLVTTLVLRISSTYDDDSWRIAHSALALQSLTIYAEMTRETLDTVTKHLRVQLASLLGKKSATLRNFRLVLPDIAELTLDGDSVRMETQDVPGSRFPFSTSLGFVSELLEHLAPMFRRCVFSRWHVNANTTMGETDGRDLVDRYFWQPIQALCATGPSRLVHLATTHMPLQLPTDVAAQVETVTLQRTARFAGHYPNMKQLRLEHASIDASLLATLPCSRVRMNDLWLVRVDNVWQIESPCSV